MSIIIDIGHPGQVHLFRYLIKHLQGNNIPTWVTIKNIPSAIELLKKYKIKFNYLGNKYDSIFLKGLNQLLYDYRLYNIVRNNKIQIGIGSSVSIAHVSRLTKLKSIILDDDDKAAVKLFELLAHPFAHSILSPGALAHQKKRKSEYFYPGYHELAYLHPRRFAPDPETIKKYGLSDNEVFFILRFVAFKGYHDVDHRGLSIEQKIKIIELLKPNGKVFITSEKKIDPELEQYRLSIDPIDIHHFLFFAKIYIGDSQTMTSEAAILGTPALKCNTFAGKLSVPNELEYNYGLCFSYQPEEFDKLILKVNELLKTDNLNKIWQEKRMRMLKDKIDVTDFLIWLLDNYPKSIRELNSADNNFWQQFK